MSEEKQAIDNLRKDLNDYIKEDSKIGNYKYISNLYSNGDIEIVLNYIDKLQEELKDSINARFELQRRIDKTQKENDELKEEIDNLIRENHKHIDYIADMKKKHEDKKKADMNKLINYIAIRENKTHEEVCKEFELGE